MMHSLFKLSILAGLVVACTPPFMSEQQNPHMTGSSDSKMNGKKKKSKSDMPSPEEPASPEPPPAASEEVSLYLKASDLKTNLSTPDVQQLRKIAASLERSPLSRATLIFGVLRAYLHDGIDPVQIEQASLLERTPVQVKDWSKSTSVEMLFQETGLSFKDELESNPFAQNIAIVGLTLRALDQDTDKNSPFATDLRAQLNNKAAQWSKVREMLAAGTPAAPQVTETVPNAVAMPPANPNDAKAPEQVPASGVVPGVVPSSEPRIDPASMNDSELIKKSAELAEKSHFHEAIKLLRRIDGSSIYASEARAKIRDVANKAVGELRTKAARSYQSAVPITDLKARGNYLSEAEGYLLKAIEQYPESDQIDTVKQNLAVIQKNLTVINK